MTFTSAPITVKDSAAADKPLIAYTDGTNSATAHPVLDNTGALISPATAGAQATGNTALAAIQTSVANIPASPATAALQTAGNSTLTTIATNTTGAATGAKQDTGNTSLATIATNTTGAATAAKQDTGNTTLAAIATNTTGVATGAKQDTGNTSLAAIATSVASIATNTGTEATAALQTTGNTSLATIATNTASNSTAANQTIANTKLDTIIANTGPKGATIVQAVTVQAAAYTSGNVLGSKLTISGFARSNSGSGLIQQAYVTKKTSLSAPVDLYIFHTDPTNSTFTDKTALAIDPLDLTKLAGVIHCYDLVSLGTPQLLQAVAQALQFKVNAANTSLFVVPVVRASEVYASTDAVSIVFGVLQD